jgi:gamma-glutamyltranspeptidase / glutathione hydrolase
MRPRRALPVVAPALLVSTLMLSPASGIAASSAPEHTQAPASLAAKERAAAATGSGSGHAVAVGTGGAVASETTGASRAGLSVLKHGGNAIDAAVATAAALGVDDPYVAGPGGGGFMVIYLAGSNKIVTIDGREMCPRRCTPKLFLDKSGNPLDFELARHSGISVGVPGMVAQWAKATRNYGRHSLASNLRPAVRLARHGFRVTQAFHDRTLQALPEQPQALPHSRRQGASRRHTVPQPRPGEDLRADWRSWAVLPVRRSARQCDRPDRATSPRCQLGTV